MHVTPSRSFRFNPAQSILNIGLCDEILDHRGQRFPESKELNAPISLSLIGSTTSAGL